MFFKFLLYFLVGLRCFGLKVLQLFLKTLLIQSDFSLRRSILESATELLKSFIKVLLSYVICLHKRFDLRKGVYQSFSINSSTHGCKVFYFLGSTIVAVPFIQLILDDFEVLCYFSMCPLLLALNPLGIDLRHLDVFELLLQFFVVILELI